MNCLFVETPEKRILIETGIGEKWSEKEISIYGISAKGPFAETLFEITDAACEGHNYRSQHPPALRPREAAIHRGGVNAPENPQSVIPVPQFTKMLVTLFKKRVPACRKSADANGRATVPRLELSTDRPAELKPDSYDAFGRPCESNKFVVFPNYQLTV